MIIELYTRSASTELPQSPVSNTTGSLPEEEPALDLRDLLGSFSSHEEALAYINQQVSEENGIVLDNRSGSFNDYTHIEWVTITLKTANEQTKIRSYYLVTDEGY